MRSGLPRLATTPLPPAMRPPVLPREPGLGWSRNRMPRVVRNQHRGLSLRSTPSFHKHEFVSKRWGLPAHQLKLNASSSQSVLLHPRRSCGWRHRPPQRHRKSHYGRAFDILFASAVLTSGCHEQASIWVEENTKLVTNKRVVTVQTSDRLISLIRLL